MRLRVPIAGALAIALLIGGAATVPARPVPRWAVCGVWRQVPTNGADGEARDLVVISPDEAWIVGRQCGPDGCDPLLLHWTGLSWSGTTIPTAHETGTMVFIDAEAVTAAGPHQVWVVGSTKRWRLGRVSAMRPYSARWDGARWVPEPVSIRGLHGALDGVARTPDGRIWAVGADTDHGSRTLVLRRTGKAWHRVASPAPGSQSAFTDATVAGGVLWAVGWWSDGGKERPLAARWTGRRWKQVDVPTIGELSAVTSAGPHRVWAVGHTPRGAVVLRWSADRRWRVAHRFEGRKRLEDVHALSARDVWVVGRRHLRGWDSDLTHPFVARWTRGTWRTQRTPAVRGRFTAIGGTPNDLWMAHVRIGPDPLDLRTDTYHRC